MRLAISATGPSLDAALDPRFGRCSHFVLVDTDDMSFEAVDNASSSLGGGAGIQAAQLVARKGAKAVLTGRCGPNAQQTLQAAGIEVFEGCGGTVSEAAARYRSHQLHAASAPDVVRHSGMGNGRR